jgi:hypothetical protein
MVTMFVCFIRGGLLEPDTSQRWSIAQIRSCPWLSQEAFLNEVEPLPLHLSHFWTSTEQVTHETHSRQDVPSTCSLYESQVRAELAELGVTTQILERANQYARENLLLNRDSINGTYRILLHRLQKQSSSLEANEQNGVVIVVDDDDNNNNNNDDGVRPSFDRSRSACHSSNQRDKINENYRRASHDISSKKHAEKSSSHASQTCAIL